MGEKESGDIGREHDGRRSSKPASSEGLGTQMKKVGEKMVEIDRGESAKRNVRTYSVREGILRGEDRRCDGKFLVFPVLALVFLVVILKENF